MRVLSSLEARMKALEDWRNRTTWGYQPQTLVDKSLEEMTVWELLAHATRFRPDTTSNAFREQTAAEIERRIAEASRPAPTPGAVIDAIERRADERAMRVMAVLEEGKDSGVSARMRLHMIKWKLRKAFPDSPMYNELADWLCRIAEASKPAFIEPTETKMKPLAKEEREVLHVLDVDEPASRIDDTSRTCQVCGLSIPEGETIGWIETQGGNRNMCVACLGKASRVFTNTQRLSCIFCGKTSEAPNSSGWSRVLHGKIVCNECYVSIQGVSNVQ